MTDMNTLTFDTLKFANRLKAAGMEPRLAEEQAVVMAALVSPSRVHAVRTPRSSMA